jgi:hypothetical protein
MRAMAILLVCLIGLAGCGTAHKVHDCSDCDPNSIEVCVYADGDYWCADPCATHAACMGGYDCMALEDQENPGHIVGVCMDFSVIPDYFGRVQYWGSENCTNACSGSMTCVQNTESPYDYYCSDSCSAHADCLTDCCSTGYCAPYYPFCD